MLLAICPACHNSISNKEKHQAGESMLCPICSELLIVKSLDPFEVELYQFAASYLYEDDYKAESAKKHQRSKSKSPHEDDFDSEDFTGSEKGNKKSKSRSMRY